MLTASIALLWISSTPLASNALVWQIEKSAYQTNEMCSVRVQDMPVVVLGADLDAYVTTENPYEVLSHESLSRTQHAASLNSGSNRYYVLGGGQTSRKLSDFMARVLIDRGINSNRIVREKVSLTTREHAQQLPLLLEPVHSLPIVLVTSALHMNRAVALFEAAGYTVCPSMSGSRYSPSAGWVGLLPYIGALNKTTYAWREFLATIKFSIESAVES